MTGGAHRRRAGRVALARVAVLAALGAMVVAAAALIPGCPGKKYVVGDFALGMDFADVKKHCIRKGWGMEEAALQDEMKPYRVFERAGDPTSTILYRLAFRADAEAKALDVVGIKALLSDGDDKIIDELSAKLGDPSEDDSGEFYTWSAEGEKATYFSRKDGKIIWVVYNDFAARF